MENELVDVFMAYTGGAAEMDGRTFLKCIRGAGLLDQGLKIPDVDLIFVKCKTRGCRKIDFKEFQHCLAEVSSKTGLADEEVMEFVCQAGLAGPSSRAGSTVLSSTCGAGPERFFYDKSTYTGTHKNGGPTAIGGGGDGSLITHEKLVNRDLEEAQQRRRFSSALPTLLGGLATADADDNGKASHVARAKSPQRPQSPLRPERFHHDRSGGLATADADDNGKTSHFVRAKSPQRTQSPIRLRSGGPATTDADDNGKASHLVRTKSPQRAQSPLGPERFYYDKSTYTGTHRNGGPSMVGNGLPKFGGYDDLSELVKRDHVQDDALHRMKSGAGRQCTQAGDTIAVSVASSTAAALEKVCLTENPLQLQPQLPQRQPLQPLLPATIATPNYSFAAAVAAEATAAAARATAAVNAVPQQSQWVGPLQARAVPGLH